MDVVEVDVASTPVGVAGGSGVTVGESLLHAAMDTPTRAAAASGRSLRALGLIERVLRVTVRCLDRHRHPNMEGPCTVPATER
jgi:hypothetical protein